jgi:hypothetical protein
MDGVAAETKDSCFIPRFCSYHFWVVAIEETVRTRWSREVIFAAGWEDDILFNVLEKFGFKR